jgi:hypothetical protein
MPGAGIARGIESISSLAVFAPTELRQAARAGALCAVVKDNSNQLEPAETDPGELLKQMTGNVVAN